MQCGVLFGACGAYFVDATAIVLPVFLLPRLHAEVWAMPPEEAKIVDAFASSLFFVGNALGLISLGAAGDKLGRRTPLLMGVALTIAVTALSLVNTPSISWFLACRALAGFGAGGALNSSFLLAVEWAPPTHRLLCKTCTATLGWAPGLLFLSAVAYATRGASGEPAHDGLTWQSLGWCLAPSPFVWAFIYFRCFESPRFFLARGEPHKALQLLQRCAAANQRCLPPAAALALPDASEAECDSGRAAYGPDLGRTEGTPSKSRAASSAASGLWCAPGTLFHKAIRRRTCLVGLAWFGSTCVYYGVVLAPLQVRSVACEDAPPGAALFSIGTPLSFSLGSTLSSLSAALSLLSRQH